MGEIGDKQAVEPLIGMIERASAGSESSGEIDRRQAAAKALAKFKDERAFQPLVTATIDGIPALRWQQASKLRPIPD